jgi:quinone-modifying oxidoreductase subunit QmoC
MAGDAQTTTTRLAPDRELLASLLGSGGEDLRQCIQCATCSAVCELADERNPGPRKEMLWAQWGLRDRLMGDPDTWLCHGCGDCTVRCPRGARPSDVMAALRREQMIHYSMSRGFGRWLGQARSLPWLVVGATVALAAAAATWAASGAGQVELALAGPRTVFPYWPRLPHWLLHAVFGLLIIFDVLVLARGGRRFWRDMNASGGRGSRAGRGLGASWRAAFRRILWHEDFARCAESRARRTSHLLVVYGMLALTLTSFWAVTARWNPLLAGLVYPFGFWNPWKILANLGGLSVVVGATLMLAERWRRPETAGATRYADGLLLGLLLLIALTGFASEGLHFLRVEPLRFGVYAAHLVSVLVLLGILPYTKLAHAVYRTLALVHAERTGRGTS